ncbi:MAG TPA: hypothetical protein VLG76_08145 [Rhabdochlamydiaceae bacterium]|nr:hypothetical protein [Rhabdochlamydiaceae bacterium]
MFIYKICEILAEARVPYAIVGGYAVAMHGVLRGTVDVDLVISWSLEHLRKVEAAFKQMGLVSRIPVTAEDLFHFRDEYMQKRNLIAWNFYDPVNPLNQVDIIITYDLKSTHVKKLKTPSGGICILSIDELIKMKQASGRPQDLEDVKALKEVSQSL